MTERETDKDGNVLTYHVMAHFWNGAMKLDTHFEYKVFRTKAKAQDFLYWRKTEIAAVQVFVSKMSLEGGGKLLGSERIYNKE